MTPLYRGNPSMAAASSLVLATNASLILRGRLGQQLQANYGPVPQNLLLRQAPKPSGSVVTVQVTAPAPSVPARWYCGVVTPAEVISSAWFLQNLTQITETYQATVQQVISEGQVPCAITPFLDSDVLLQDPDCISALVTMMTSVTLPDGFFFITDQIPIFDALYNALYPPAAPEPEPVAAPESAPESEVVEEPKASDDTYGLDVSPDTAEATTPPAKKRGRPRKG